MRPIEFNGFRGTQFPSNPRGIAFVFIEAATARFYESVGG